jgi:hypothetical protein
MNLCLPSQVRHPGGAGNKERGTWSWAACNFRNNKVMLLAATSSRPRKRPSLCRPPARLSLRPACCFRRAGRQCKMKLNQLRVLAAVMVLGAVGLAIAVQGSGPRPRGRRLRRSRPTALDWKVVAIDTVRAVALAKFPIEALTVSCAAEREGGSCRATRWLR